MRRKNYYFFIIDPLTGEASVTAWRGITEKELKEEFDQYKKNKSISVPGWAVGWMQGNSLKNLYGK